MTVARDYGVKSIRLLIHRVDKLPIEKIDSTEGRHMYDKTNIDAISRERSQNNWIDTVEEKKTKTRWKRWN